MAHPAADWPTLLAGSLLLRPYIFNFLVAFLVLAVRDLGWRRTWGWLGWGWAVAYAAEYASTRIGIPFGLFHYTGETASRELFVSNVPFFDPLSFPFLAYASYCLPRWALGQARGWAPAALTGALMMLLDVVMDPLAVRGESWFLGITGWIGERTLLGARILVHVAVFLLVYALKAISVTRGCTVERPAGAWVVVITTTIDERGY